MVLLTKADLAGPGLALARAAITALAPRAIPMIELAEGVVDPRVILGLTPPQKTIWPPAPRTTTGRTTTNMTTSPASW
jgi:hypothetical protein